MPLDIWGGDIWEQDPTKRKGLDLGVQPDDLSSGLRRSIASSLLPSPDMVAAKEEEQTSGIWGTIGTILSIPEKVLFGQAIKGAIKGGIEGGFEGAAKGFARGTPFAFLGEALGLGDLADETRFADIRRATGETNVDEGAVNFTLNLLGDVLLSPFELGSGGLFGLTGTAARGAQKAGIANAIRAGERAAFVFKIPFSEVVIGSTNLGFKSGAVMAGQALDNVGSFLRKNPVTGAVVSVFSHKSRVSDPEVAALGPKAVGAMDATRRAAMGMALEMYQSLPAETRTLIASGKYSRVANTLIETGVNKLDEGGTYEGVLARLANPDVMVREARREALLSSPKHGKVLQNLWNKTSSRDPEEAVAAIKAIYDRFPDVPLPDDMLKAAELAPRVNVELSWVQKPELGVAGGLDDAVRGIGLAEPSVAGPGKRFRSATEAPQPAVEAVLRARAKLQNDFTALVDEIKAGTVNKEGVEQFIAVHRTLMTDIFNADLQIGFLNESMEPFAGLYAARIMSPETMKLVEDHFAATLNKYNYSIPRKLRDMTAIEVNAVVEDFGTKATGFASLKKLRDTKPETVLGAIFDHDFLRMLYKKDPVAAEFFQMLPDQNLFERVAASATRQGKAQLGKVFFHDESAAVQEILDPVAFSKRIDEFGPGSDRVPVVEVNGINPKSLNIAEGKEFAAKVEIDAQYEIASHQIREDFERRALDTKGDFDADWEDLRAARDLNETSAPMKLAQKKNELLASANMKRATLNVQAASDEKNLADELLKIHRQRTKGLPITSDAGAVAAYDEIASGASDLGGKEIRPVSGKLYRDVSSISELYGKSGKIEWNPSGRAASDSFKWASLDGGVLLEFSPDGAVGRGGAYKGMNWSRPTSGGMPERIFVNVDSPPPDDVLKEISESFPNAKIVNVKTVGEDSIESLVSVSSRTKVSDDALTASLVERAGRAKDVLRAQRELHAGTQKSIDDLIDQMSNGLDEITGEASDAVKANRADRRDALGALLADKGKRTDIVRRLREKGLSSRAFAQEMVLQKRYGAEGIMALDEAATIFQNGVDGPTILDRMKGTWDANTKIKIVSRESHEAYKKLVADMTRSDPFQDSGIVRMLDDFKGAWAGHTVYNPLFLQTRARNWIQSSISALSGGLYSPMGQFEAAKAMRALGKGLEGDPTAMEALGAVTLKGTKVSLKDALQKARQLGVVGAGGYAYEAGLTVEQAAMLKGGATLKQYVKDIPSLILPVKKVKDSPFLQAGMKLESKLDDHARLAAFFGGLKKGMDFDTAAGEVRKWLYDSTKPMTWTERTVFRRLIPFYSFQKYAVGQAFDLYFSRPAAVTTYEKIRENAVAAAGLDQKDLDTVLPQYIADGYGIPYQNTDRGPEMGLFGTFIPVGEVAKIASIFDSYFKGDNNLDPSLRYIVGNMHPVIRAGIEQAFGRDLYSDKPFTDSPRELFGISMPPVAVRFAQQLRFVNEINRLNLLNLNEFKVMIDAVDRQSAEAQSSFGSKLASSAFSPLPKPRAKVVDVGKEARYRQALDDQQLRSAKSRIVRAAVGKAGATTEDEIALAQEQFAEAAARTRRRDRISNQYKDPNAEPKKAPSDPLERFLLGRYR